MPDTDVDAKSSHHGAATRRNRLISLLLIGFTVLVAVACIVVLSVTLTQTRVATLVIIDGVGVSIPKLDYVGRRWVSLRKDNIRLRELEDKRNDLAAEAAAAELDLKAKTGDLEDVLAAFYHRIATSETTLAEAIRGRGYPDQYGRIAGAKSDLIKRQPELGPVIEEIETAYKSYRTADGINDTAQAKLKVVQRQIDILKKRIEDEDASNFAVIKLDLSKDKDGKARVETAFYELNIDNHDCGLGDNKDCGLIAGLINRGFYRLLTLRPDLLTLLLVILMGVLGSALQITHAYFMKNQVQTPGGYFQRITVGAMTALVIFIVAKAGVPVIADPSRLGGDAPINPYFVSFLAIISGLLSENAIVNIQAQGARLFGTGSGEPDRYARIDLTAVVQEQQISLAHLASQVGKSEEAVRSMLEGNEKIDPTQQRTIALYLRREPRDIYTDIPPPTK
jgi:hypothetical protein